METRGVCKIMEKGGRLALRQKVGASPSLRREKWVPFGILTRLTVTLAKHGFTWKSFRSHNWNEWSQKICQALPNRLNTMVTEMTRKYCFPHTPTAISPPSNLGYPATSWWGVTSPPFPLCPPPQSPLSYSTPSTPTSCRFCHKGPEHGLHLLHCDELPRRNTLPAWLLLCSGGVAGSKHTHTPTPARGGGRHHR